jgi:hypothetical protein
VGGPAAESLETSVNTRSELFFSLGGSARAIYRAKEKFLVQSDRKAKRKAPNRVAQSEAREKGRKAVVRSVVNRLPKKEYKKKEPNQEVFIEVGSSSLFLSVFN